MPPEREGQKGPNSSTRTAGPLTRAVIRRQMGGLGHSPFDEGCNVSQPFGHRRGPGVALPLTECNQEKPAHDSRQLPRGKAMKTHTDSPVPDVQALPLWGGPVRARSTHPDDRTPSPRNETRMSNEPIKARKPSRCNVCSLDVRRGVLIVYLPKDAKPGQPRTWVHEGCA